uniref:Variant surface glycoprotein 1379 n=1 Tax=Trypanosoma brucei TaxID=5691 RepID=M4SYD4_9TRYP|nr:variant surface glycoprotein 1379 [Trypanosoma brucei]
MWQLFVCLVTTAIFFVRPCDSADCDNAKQHAIMCNLAAIAQVTPKSQPQPADVAATVAQLEQLNFTTSDTNWTALFDLSESDKEGRTFPASFKSNPLTKSWQESWAHWYDTAERAKAAKIGTTENKEYLPISDTQEKQAAHKHIRALTARAKRRQQTYKDYAGQQKDFGAATVSILLKKALFGGDGALDKVTASTSFGNGENWDGSCEKTNVSKSIAGDFVCLCNNDKDAEKTCGNGVTSTQFNTAIALTTAWANIKNSCPERPGDKITTPQVAAALSEFRSALKIDTTSSTHKVLFGKDTASACDGRKGKVCIDYAENFKRDGSKSWNTIPWVKTLLKAAEQTDNVQTKARAADAIAGEIRDILAEAKEIYAAAVNGQLSIKTITDTIASNQPATATKDSDEVNQKAKTACKQHKAKKL